MAVSDNDKYSVKPYTLHCTDAPCSWKDLLARQNVAHADAIDWYWKCRNIFNGVLTLRDGKIIKI